MHVDLTQNDTDIRTDERRKRILKETFYSRSIIDGRTTEKVHTIILPKRNDSRDSCPEKKRENPRPCKIHQTSESKKRENPHSDKTQKHTKKLDSFSIFCILRDREKCGTDLHEIQSDEKKTHDLNRGECMWIMEIILSEPWSCEKESDSDDDARENLRYECQKKEDFRTSIVFFYDKFRDEIVQALSHPEVIIDREKRDEADQSIKKSEITQRKIIR